MGRPKRVFPKNLPQFNLLHTRKVKMYCGTELTALHIVKETEQYYISIDTWSSCCSPFKLKKKNGDLSYNIPVLKDEKAISFLNKNAWHDWLAKELATTQINIFSKDRELVPHIPDSDTVETIAFLDRLFPDKKKVYFYELTSIISSFCHGTFISYDEEHNIEEPSDHAIKQRGYQTRKYNGKYKSDEVIVLPENVNALYAVYDKMERSKENEKAKQAAYHNYAEAEEAFLLANHNLTDTFIALGENAVVCPYAYTHCCVKGSAYENAGEIYFIVTDDTVYFQDERHF